MAKKNKTHKATKKRVKVTRRGKVVHRAKGSGGGHLKANKNSKQKARKQGKKVLDNKSLSKKIKSLTNN